MSHHEAQHARIVALEQTVNRLTLKIAELQSEALRREMYLANAPLRSAGRALLAHLAAPAAVNTCTRYRCATDCPVDDEGNNL